MFAQRTFAFLNKNIQSRSVQAKARHRIYSVRRVMDASFGIAVDNDWSETIFVVVKVDGNSGQGNLQLCMCVYVYYWSLRDCKFLNCFVVYVDECKRLLAALWKQSSPHIICSLTVNRLQHRRQRRRQRQRQRRHHDSRQSHAAAFMNLTAIQSMRATTTTTVTITCCTASERRCRRASALHDCGSSQSIDIDA